MLTSKDKNPMTFSLKIITLHTPDIYIRLLFDGRVSLSMGYTITNPWTHGKQALWRYDFFSGRMGCFLQLRTSEHLEEMLWCWLYQHRIQDSYLLCHYKRGQTSMKTHLFEILRLSLQVKDMPWACDRWLYARLWRPCEAPGTRPSSVRSAAGLVASPPAPPC